jgi:hypothetical protein
MFYASPRRGERPQLPRLSKRSIPGCASPRRRPGRGPRKVLFADCNVKCSDQLLSGKIAGRWLSFGAGAARLTDVPDIPAGWPCSCLWPGGQRDRPAPSHRGNWIDLPRIKSPPLYSIVLLELMSSKARTCRELPVCPAVPVSAPFSRIPDAGVYRGIRASTERASTDAYWSRPLCRYRHDAGRGRVLARHRDLHEYQHAARPERTDFSLPTALSVPTALCRSRVG